ncbi:Oidioi.mRNA.OKI2018_I69.PAR.g10098.t1.cds [Oikopleura dioica]|uniref:Oidioi.mRNA.OKI2018_I69.PAR.g10098.t1.cds n=1 Tax=Oikopleura dioica TaxID=34765 RepID=A0ABN7RWL8_OIKDI|nr:Oidioi.mRNA.OKI2018_I69.PAR.g10098.t1.cds [Oikopleura dioica]
MEKNSFPWRGDEEKKMLNNYARIARIDEGIRFGCAGALIDKTDFATLLECDYHMFHYMPGFFPKDDNLNHNSSPKDIEDKFKQMVADGEIYIFYGGTGPIHGKFVKVKSTKKMETHMFLETVEEFERPASITPIADLTMYNKKVMQEANEDCVLFGSYRYEHYFLNHPKNSFFAKINVRFQDRDEAERRPILRVNPRNPPREGVGFIPTFEEFGSPIYCKDSGKWFLMAFLDKTSLKTIAQIDELIESSENPDWPDEIFEPMQSEFRVKRDNAEIYIYLLTE